MKKNIFKDKFGLKDLFMLIGGIGLFYGIFKIYPPAAFIVVSLGLIYLGVR